MSTRILRNTTAYMLAGLIPNLVNLVLLPVYTRLIPPKDFGIHALVVMTCSFLSSFGGLQLGNALTRFYVTYEGPKLRTYFSTLFFMALSTNLVMFGLLQVLGPWMTGHLYGNSSFPYFPYMFLGSFQFLFMTQITFLNIALRMQERGGRFFVLAMAYMIVDVITGLYLILFRDMGVVGLLTARALSSGVYTLLLVHTLRDLFTLKLDPRTLGESIRYSLPTIPHSLANIVFNFADKFLLGHFLDPSAVGLYDLANRFSRVFQRVLQAFDRAYVPGFFRQSEISKAEATRSLESVIAKWMVYSVLAAVGISLFAQEVIYVMAAPAYHSAYTLIPILVSGCLLRGLYYFPANAILFEKKTHLIPCVTVSSGLLNIVLNLWLIPKYGTVEVAAWTTAGSLGFSFLFTALLAYRHYPIKWPVSTFLFLMIGMAASIWSSRTIPSDSLWTSLAIKMGIVLLFASLNLLFNMGNTREDLTHAFRFLQRILPKTRHSTP